MLKAVRPGGEIHIADYCRQPDRLMRNLFRIIQGLDGHETTQPNADGMIERLLSDHARLPVFAQVRDPDADRRHQPFRPRQGLTRKLRSILKMLAPPVAGGCRGAA